MNEKLFEELVQSVREGGMILKGEAAPSRAFEMDRLTMTEPPGRQKPLVAS